MEDLEIINTAMLDKEILAAGPLPVDNRTARQKYADSLREFAAFIEAHPYVALPSTEKMYVFPQVNEMESYAHALGKCRKSACETYFNLTKDFLPAIQYEPTWYRNQVCERVVVGQKEEVRDIVQVIGKETVVVDVVEWKCPKVLQPKLGESSEVIA